ncbi:MAG: hypothetical protein QNJ56_00635 [Gammaproteobacteria bacterium]|nr:hypothetical protein [Gammaproteobacteria bacterium]
MITKILFTLSVIIAIFIFMRIKHENQATQSRKIKKAEPSENQKLFRQGAYLFLIFMVVSALAVMYFELGDRYAKVTVHVINTQTGQRVTYQAEQQDIKSHQFKTLKGRTIYIADIERMEIEPQ